MRIFPPFFKTFRPKIEFDSPGSHLKSSTNTVELFVLNIIFSYFLISAQRTSRRKNDMITSGSHVIRKSGNKITPLRHLRGSICALASATTAMKPVASQPVKSSISIETAVLCAIFPCTVMIRPHTKDTTPVRIASAAATGIILTISISRHVSAFRRDFR